MSQSTLTKNPKLAAPKRHTAARKGTQASKVWGTRIVIVGIILTAWQISSNIELVNPLFASSPLAIASAFDDVIMHPSFGMDVQITLAEVALGFAIGSALGSLAGLLLGSFATIRQAMVPILNMLNAIPRIALVPLFVAWFGLGMTPRVVTAVTIVFFVMATTVVAALANPDRDLDLLARSLGATGWTRLRKFVLPASIPVIASGLELSLIYTFLGVIGAEILSGTYGVGTRMTEYTNLLQADRFFALLIILTVFAVALTAIVRMIEGRLLVWHKHEKMNS